MRVLLPQHGSTLVGVNCTLKKSVAIRLIYVKLQFFDSHVKQLSPLIQQVYLVYFADLYFFPNSIACQRNIKSKYDHMHFRTVQIRLIAVIGSSSFKLLRKRWIMVMNK